MEVQPKDGRMEQDKGLQEEGGRLGERGEGEGEGGEEEEEVAARPKVEEGQAKVSTKVVRRGRVVVEEGHGSEGVT